MLKLPAQQSCFAFIASSLQTSLQASLQTSLQASFQALFQTLLEFAAQNFVFDQTVQNRHFLNLLFDFSLDTDRS